MVKYLTCIFFSFSIFCFAQTDFPIEKPIQKINAIENKKDISNEDIDEMLKQIDLILNERAYEALIHLEKTRKLLEARDYQKGWVDYCYKILKIYRFSREIEKSKNIILEVKESLGDKLTKENWVSFQFMLADIANAQMEINRSLQMAREALPDAVTNFQKGSLNYIISVNYQETNQNKEALTYALRALEYYKLDNDDRSISLIYNLMSIIYQQINNNEKAKYYSKLSLKYAKKAGSVNNILDTYSNLVVAYRGLNQIDSAKYIFNKIIELATKFNRPYPTAQARMNMGNLYSDEKDYLNAEKQFKLSLALSKQHKISEGILYNYINLGANYQARKMYRQSAIAYDSAMYYAKKMDVSSSLMAYIYEGYTTLYENTGNYKKALDSYKIMDSLNAAVNMEQTQKEIAEIQGKYDSAVKDAQLEKMKHENQNKKSQIKVIIGSSLFILLITGLIISFLIYRNRNLRQLYQRNVDLVNLYSIKKNELINREPATSNPLEKIFNELILEMEKEKLYQNPDLTIADAAQKINSNQKYVSNAIAEFTNMNFNNFVNRYRIHEAKRLIIQNKYPTLNEIMYASGFNSRTPFYNAFNKFTGMSPKQFKDQAVKSNNEEIQAGKKSLIEV